MKTVDCLARLDGILAESGPMKPGDVAGVWSDTGKRIIVDGLFVGRSSGWLPPHRAIRWHTEGEKRGLFGRGLALYGNRLPAWALALPRVR